MKAAVPQYMQQHLSEAAPGHVFGLYFPVWDTQWELVKDKKTEAVHKVVIRVEDNRRLDGLLERQRGLSISLGDCFFATFAKATAPFVTGMGYEHPLENGFAFLNPYGLPYLPGSSIKGVLLAAAKELALDEIIIAELFGSSAEDGKQGGLNFWDVLPKGKLALDIMTPHYGEYYQGKESPHDAGQPNPIVFLTVAPGADFAFYVQRIHTLQCDWQTVLEKCFDHAFDWLGFGAKTAVGYGAMICDKDEEGKWSDCKKEYCKKAKILAMTPEERELAEIEQKRTGWNRNHGDFLLYVEQRLEENEPLTPQVLQIFQELLEEYYNGIMNNPDAVYGKKQKPRYKERPKKLAIKLTVIS